VSSYNDKRLTCADCHGEFVWSAEEQEFFREKDYRAQALQAVPTGQEGAA
jgi:hypothetical protein